MPGFCSRKWWGLFQRPRQLILCLAETSVDAILVIQGWSSEQKQRNKHTKQDAQFNLNFTTTAKFFGVSMSYGIFGTYSYLKILDMYLNFKFNWTSCISSVYRRQERHWQGIAHLGIQKPEGWGERWGVDEDRRGSAGSQELHLMLSPA